MSLAGEEKRSFERKVRDIECTATSSLELAEEASQIAEEEKKALERKMRDIESAATSALDVLIHTADGEKERRQCEKETKIYLLQAEKEELVELEQLLLKSEGVIMCIERIGFDLQGATMVQNRNKCTRRADSRCRQSERREARRKRETERSDESGSLSTPASAFEALGTNHTMPGGRDITGESSTAS